MPLKTSFNRLAGNRVKSADKLRGPPWLPYTRETVRLEPELPDATPLPRWLSWESAGPLTG